MVNFFSGNLLKKTILLYVLLKFASYDVVTAQNLCSANTNYPREPEPPKMPNVYSATYEFMSPSQSTVVLEEEYHEENEKFSLTTHSNGETKSLYETGDNKDLFFLLTAKGKCTGIPKNEISKSDFFPKLRKSFKKLAEDKNIYLKLLVELPKSYFKGYVSKTSLPVNNIPVDHWLYCLDNVAINIYWSANESKTHAASPYPVQVTVNYGNAFEENFYIFKFLANQVNETALNFPENVYCPNKGGKLLNSTIFVGNDMKFTTEVVDPVRKTISTSTHTYALEDRVVKISTTLPTPQNKARPLEYVFDLNLGYYFEVHRQAGTCSPKSIGTAQEHLGDLFQINNDILSDNGRFGKSVNYYFDKKAWRRGIRTDMYKGYKEGYPLGDEFENTNSIINWHIAEKNQNNQMVPVALEFYVSRSNSVSGKILEKITYDLFDWDQTPSYYSLSQFYMYYCTIPKKRSTYLKMTLTYPILNIEDDDFIPSSFVEKNLRSQLALVGQISVLRFYSCRLDSPMNGRVIFHFTVLPKFKGISTSNSTDDAFNAWSATINSGDFTIFVKTKKSKEDHPLKAIANSLILKQ